jgi:hypothetical protein
MNDALMRLTPALFFAAALLLGAWALLTGIVAIVQRRLHLRQRRADRLAVVWLPLLRQSGSDAPSDLPTIAARDRELLLDLWLRERGDAEPERAARLDTIGRAMGFDRLALRLLAGRNGQRRARGIATAGYLKQAEAWDRLLSLTAQRDSLRAAAASWALLRIDAARFTPELARLVVRRPEWTNDLVRGLLDDAPQAPVAAALDQAGDQADLATLPRLLRLLADLGEARTPALARRTLSNSDDPNALAAALRCLREPRDGDLAQARLGHSVWFVRLQAVAAVSRLGAPQARATLQPLLDDPEWWVRQRAAEALTALDEPRIATLAGAARASAGGSAIERQTRAEAPST